MVERSNTLVLGTNLFGGLGSNPSRVIFGSTREPKSNAPAGARTLDHRLIRPRRCQLRHKSLFRGVTGGYRVGKFNLGVQVGRTSRKSSDGLVGYDDALTQRRSRVRSPVGVAFCYNSDGIELRCIFWMIHTESNPGWVWGI